MTRGRRTTGAPPGQKSRARDDAERPNAPPEQNSTKPAATPDTRQAKDGQPSDAGEPAANVMRKPRGCGAAAVPGAGRDRDRGWRGRGGADGGNCRAGDEAGKVGDETATVTVDATITESTTTDATTETASPVAAVLPTPEPAKTAPAPTTDEVAIAPVDLKAAAPAAPADGAPEAPADDATPEKIAAPKDETVKAEPAQARARQGGAGQGGTREGRARGQDRAGPGRAKARGADRCRVAGNPRAEDPCGPQARRPEGEVGSAWRREARGRSGGARRERTCPHGP